MTSVLMHTCCAPCSLSCIDPLRAEGIEPVAFWYNPNIHPWKEYEARRDCLLTYAPTIEMQVIVDEDYGLRTFVEHVAKRYLTTAAPTVISTDWRKRPGTPRSTAMGPLPPPCWPVSIRITTASRPRRRNTPGSTAWNFSTGISGPISGQAISGPESLAFICRSTAAASFPSRTATRSRSTGTRKNLRSRCNPRTVHIKKTF